MSRWSASAFLRDIATDRELQHELTDLADRAGRVPVDRLLSLAERRGFEITAADWEAAHDSVRSLLHLEAVSSGSNQGVEVAGENTVSVVLSDGTVIQVEPSDS